MAEPKNTGANELERRISLRACNVLNELRKSGELVDAVIKVDGGQFKVHRAIMSACSPYFRAMFTNGMRETNQKEVYISGVTDDMMAHIVEYAYTRETIIDIHNVERLLSAADQFHVLGLIKACLNFLTTHLDAKNCIGILKFSRNYFCPNLERAALRFIMENFQEVYTESNEILNLNIEEMVEILSSDDLNVKNEELVFDAILRWINHDAEQRKKCTLSLIKCVRLGRLSTPFFVENVKVNMLYFGILLNTTSDHLQQ